MLSKTIALLYICVLLITLGNQTQGIMALFVELNIVPALHGLILLHVGKMRLEWWEIIMILI